MILRRTRTLSVLALSSAALLLVACSSTPERRAATASTGQTGAAAGATGSVDATTTGYTPGSNEELTAIGNTVYFGYDRHDLTSEAQAQLQRQADWLKTYPNVAVTLEGHADERGTREYNLALGERRAQAVRNFLVALGVEPTRLQTISYGKERPAALGFDEASHAQNRRSVTVVQ